MSTQEIAQLQTPQKRPTIVRSTEHTLLPTEFPESTPDSHSSAESRTDYLDGVWDSDSNAIADEPLTPDTPITPDDSHQLSRPHDSSVTPSKPSRKEIPTLDTEAVNIKTGIKVEDTSRRESIFGDLRQFENADPVATAQFSPWRQGDHDQLNFSKVSVNLASQFNNARYVSSKTSSSGTSTSGLLNVPGKNTHRRKSSVEENNREEEVALFLSILRERTMAQIQAGEKSKIGDGTQTQHQEYTTTDQKFTSVDNARSRRTTKKSKQSKIVFTKTSVRNETLAEIIPLHWAERVVKNHSICAASFIKNPSERCSNKCNGSVTTLIELLDNIPVDDVRLDNPSVLEYIKAMIRALFCGTHRNSATPRLEKLCEMAHKPENDWKDLNIWLEALFTVSISTTTETLAIEAVTDCQPGSQNQTISATQSIKRTTVHATKSGSIKTHIRTTITVQTQRGQYIQKLSPYCPPVSLPEMPISDAILTTLRKRLTDRELNSGFLYIYWFPPNFGHIKIGVTTKIVAKRLRQWEKKCKHPIAEHKTEIQEERLLTPHIHRVERLIQVELREFRRREENCHGCKKNHTEWFQIPLDEATRIAKKWTKWMRTEPYEKIREKGKTKWRLKETIDSAIIEKLCLPQEQTPHAPDIKAKSRRGSRVKNRKSI